MIVICTATSATELAAECVLRLQRAPHYSLFGTPDYEQWRHYRKTMNPAFSPDNVRKASFAVCVAHHC